MVIIDDNLEKAVNRIAREAGDTTSERMRKHVINRDALERIFAENDIYGVIHFAGFSCGRERRKAARVLLQQSHQHAHFVRRHAQAWLQAYCVQLERYGVWRAR